VTATAFHNLVLINYNIHLSPNTRHHSQHLPSLTFPSNMLESSLNSAKSTSLHLQYMCRRYVSTSKRSAWIPVLSLGSSKGSFPTRRTERRRPSDFPLFERRRRQPFSTSTDQTAQAREPLLPKASGQSPSR
jgi:hypothetical protein